MPLTSRGLWLATFGLIAGLGAKMLGLADLWMLAAAALAAVLAAVVYVRVRGVRLRTTRLVTPPRVPAGGSARIQVSVTNQGRFRSPVLVLSDPWDDGVRVAEFRLAPVAKGEQIRATYRIPTEERGLFTLGPLSVTVTDPLGLARRRKVIGDTTDLTVYPPTVEVLAPRDRRGADPHQGQLSHNAVGQSGDQFHSLRPYVVGDDLRRIHWRTSARTIDLQVRQDEAPWRGRCTVAVDGREDAHTEETFELAMSVTASLLRAAVGTGLDVRLLDTAGTDLDASGATAQLDQMFERLALAEPDTGSAREMLGRAGQVPVILVTTPRALAGDVLTPALSTGLTSGVVLAVGPTTDPLPTTVAGLSVLPVPSLPLFPSVWQRYVHDSVGAR